MGCHDDVGNYDATPAGLVKALERVSQYKETFKIVDHGEKVEVVNVVNGKDVEFGDFYRTRAACEAAQVIRNAELRALIEQYGHTPSSREEVEKKYGLDPH